MKTKYKYLILIIVTILASILIYNYIEENTIVDTKTDLLAIQNDIENSILEDTDYTINNPKVILNPYDISPLTALVIFKTNDLASVTVTIKGKDDDADIINTTMPSKLHLVTIYGLYPNYNNTVIISASGEEKVLKIKTDKLPNGLNNANSYENLSDDFYFTTSSDINGFPVAYDNNGNIRWYLTKNYNWDFTRLSNGYILLGNADLMKDPYYASGLVEMDLLGKIYYEYNIPGGYHHDVYEKTDGNLIAISNDFSSNATEDIVVEINRNTGDIIKSFDVSKLLGIKKEKKSIALNSIAYDAETNSILAVGSKKDMIIDIDYNTEEINWIIGDENNINKKFQKYLLNGDGEIQFPIKPQAITLKNNSIVYINSKDNKNTMVQYEVNTYSRTFKEISSIELDDYSNEVNIDYTNDYFVITQGNKIKKIYNNEVNNIMITKNNIYSAKPSKMYAGDVFITGRGERLGNTGITPTAPDHNVIINKKDDSIYKHYNLSLSSDAKRLIVKGTFKKSDNVQIILDNVLSKKTYDVDVTDGIETTSGKIETSTYINKQGVYGKYYIYLKINGVNYKLNKYVIMD